MIPTLKAQDLSHTSKSMKSTTAKASKTSNKKWSKKKIKLTQKSNWDVKLGWEVASSVAQNENGRKDVSTLSMSLDVTYILDPSLITFVSTSVIRGLQGVEDTDYNEVLFDNTYIGLNHQWLLGNHFNLNSSVTGVLPTNKVEYKQLYLDGRVALSEKLSYLGLKFHSGLVEQVVIGYGVSYIKSFYEYNTDATGFNYNVDQVLVHELFFHTHFGSALTIECDFKNLHRWNTNSTRLPDIFSMSQKIKFHVNKQWSMYLKHQMDGNTFDEYGRKYEIRPYDDRNSIIMGGVEYLF